MLVLQWIGTTKFILYNNFKYRHWDDPTWYRYNEGSERFTRAISPRQTFKLELV